MPGHRIIHVHPDAPPKPALGAACNGCGLCCLTEPCPVGMVLSRRRQGACIALRWIEPQQRYACAALVWRGSNWLTRLLERPLRVWMARMIAAGSGCDADFEAQALDPGLGLDARSAGKPLVTPPGDAARMAVPTESLGVSRDE